MSSGAPAAVASPSADRAPTATILPLRETLSQPRRSAWLSSCQTRLPHPEDLDAPAIFGKVHSDRVAVAVAVLVAAKRHVGSTQATHAWRQRLGPILTGDVHRLKQRAAGRPRLNKPIGDRLVRSRDGDRDDEGGRRREVVSAPPPHRSMSRSSWAAVCRTGDTAGKFAVARSPYSRTRAKANTTRLPLPGNAGPGAAPQR